MICKKCGCDILIKEGDMFICSKCKAKYLDIGFDPENSITNQIEKINRGEIPSPAKVQPVEKETPIVNTEPSVEEFSSKHTDKEEIKAEETVAEPITVEEPRAEEIVTEPIAVEEPKAEEIVAEPIAVEEQKAEEIVAEPIAVEEPKAEETIAEPIAVEEPKAEETIAEPIAVEEPKAEEIAEKEPAENSPTEENNTENSTEQKEKPAKKKEKKAKKEKAPKEKKKSSKKADNDTVNEEDGKSNESPKKQKSKFKEVIDFIFPIILALVIALILKRFVIANAVVPTGSMIPTINEKDRIIASRLAYTKESPERYDVVMFYFPDNESTIFVKRVMGLPGETVEVINGKVYITTQSGKRYATSDSFVNKDYTASGTYGPFYIPAKGEEITTDGDYCYAQNGEIVGSTSFINMYCKKGADDKYYVSENLYFMIGDNINSSMDSRMWTNKYVAESKILGKVIFKYWPEFEKFD